MLLMIQRPDCRYKLYQSLPSQNLYVHLFSGNTSDGKQVAPTGDEEKVTFTPYESPLRLFKSYRYHPSYAQDVAGGFLSLTYSHQIDADKLLCPHESAGETCTDAHCPYQHFRDLSITGAYQHRPRPAFPLSP